jgi:heat shock protein HtpX
MNGIKTVVLLGALSALLLMGGEAFGGRQGLYLGLGLAFLMNFAGYFFSEKIALSMYSAKPVTETERTQVYRRVGPLVRNLTMQQGLPMPRLWLIDEPSPNAFATGRNPAHASVAVTSGLLELLDDRELEGVLAHERNRDILIASVAAMIAAAITLVARLSFFFGGRDDDDNRGGALGMLFMLILAPLAAMLIQMAISRTREYSADAAAARATGSPYGLISALQKLEVYSKRIPMDASPATAHMFIIKPFSGQSMMRLFSTHPSTERRIARLQQA